VKHLQLDSSSSGSSSSRDCSSHLRLLLLLQYGVAA
jgi:hypothetical protein